MKLGPKGAQGRQAGHQAPSPYMAGEPPATLTQPVNWLNAAALGQFEMFGIFR